MAVSTDAQIRAAAGQFGPLSPRIILPALVICAPSNRMAPHPQEAPPLSRQHTTFPFLLLSSGSLARLPPPSSSFLSAPDLLPSIFSDVGPPQSRCQIAFHLATHLPGPAVAYPLPLYQAIFLPRKKLGGEIAFLRILRPVTTKRPLRKAASPSLFPSPFGPSWPRPFPKRA